MKIKANETVQIDYLGVFEKDTETELDEYQIGWFEYSKGVPLTQENLPEGVELLDAAEPENGVTEAAASDPDFPQKEA